MTEERIREEIAKALWLYDREHHLTPCEGYSFHPIALPEMALSLDMNTVHYGKLANQILPLEGIRIEAENQDLPRPTRFKKVIPLCDWEDLVKDMLTPDSEGNVWVKCLKKKEEHGS